MTRTSGALETHAVRRLPFFEFPASRHEILPTEGILGRDPNRMWAYVRKSRPTDIEIPCTSTLATWKHMSARTSMPIQTFLAYFEESGDGSSRMRFACKVFSAVIGRIDGNTMFWRPVLGACARMSGRIFLSGHPRWTQICIAEQKRRLGTPEPIHI